MPRPSYSPGKPSTEIERFTDRETEQQIFAHFVNMPAGEVPRLPALMFYGVGGIGKSWLIRHLQAQLITAWRGVPSVRIDFTLEGASNRLRDDPSAALAVIREITPAACPRFDLAYAYLQVNRGVRDESVLDHPVRKTAFNVVNEFIKGTLGMIPGPGLALQLGYTILGKLYPDLQRRVGLDKFADLLQRDVQMLRELPAEDIERQLVWRLAEDLREDNVLPLRAYKAVQAVVFVDTLEALEPVDASTSTLEIRTRWLRDIICELDDRILFVFAGQNALAWDRFDPDWCNDTWIKQNSVQGLAEPDARRFLASCRVEDSAVQQAMLKVCLSADDRYHTFHLGLLADLAWIEREVNTRNVKPDLFASLPPGDWTALALRFLKSLGDQSDADWICRLAFTPEFDESAARNSYSEQHSQPQDTRWRMLRSFSFVVPAVAKTGWFTIHSAMQRAIAEHFKRYSDQIRLIHEWWYGYWRSRTSSSADLEAPLAWYHHWHLDPRKAIDEWCERSEHVRSVQPVNMQLHYDLLSWWQPILPQFDQDAWTEIEAQAAGAIAREYCRATLGDRGENLGEAIRYCQRALAVYDRDHFPESWASVQNILGNAYRRLPTGVRRDNLREAIACTMRSLEIYTREQHPQEWARAQNNLGISFGLRGDWKSVNKAIACYERALEVYTREEFPDKWAMVQNNLGNAYGHLFRGERKQNLLRAIGYHQQALTVYQRDRHPYEWARIQNNLGNAYSGLYAHEGGDNSDKAVECFNKALEIYTRNVFPDEWSRVQRNLAAAQQGAGHDPVFEEADRRVTSVWFVAKYGSLIEARTAISSCRKYLRGLENRLNRDQRAKVKAVLTQAREAVGARVTANWEQWAERRREWINRKQVWVQRTRQKVEKTKKYLVLLADDMDRLNSQLARTPPGQRTIDIQQQIATLSEHIEQVNNQVKAFEGGIQATESAIAEAARNPRSVAQDLVGMTLSAEAIAAASNRGLVNKGGR